MTLAFHVKREAQNDPNSYKDLFYYLELKNAIKIDPILNTEIFEHYLSLIE